MRFHRLSKQRVRRVLNSPQRIEEGIAPGTIAMMQRAGSVKHPYEIWTMIQRTQTDADDTRIHTGKFLRKSALSRRKSASIKVISAWKYPGRTKPSSEIALDFLHREYGDYITK